MQKQSYKDLEIYQIAHRLAVQVHKMSLEEYDALGKRIYRFRETIQRGL